MTTMVRSFPEFERVIIGEPTSAGLAQARAEGRIGGGRRKLDEKQHRVIAESIVYGRESGSEMIRLYGLGESTASGIVPAHRQGTDFKIRVGAHEGGRYVAWHSGSCNGEAGGTIAVSISLIVRRRSIKS